MNDSLIASSGTLIASSLESAGYYYQSFVLDTLTSPFAHVAGGFLYLVGALAAVVFFLISGEVRNTIWMLLAPGLFLSCIAIRTPTTGSKWIFGAKERDQELVTQQVEYILEKATNGKISADSYEANISKLFAGYNKTISSVVNEFVRVINGDRLNADKMFIARDQLFAAMNFSMVHDRGFIDLLHAGLMDNCGDLLDAGQQMVNPLMDQCNRCRAAITYQKLLQQPYPLTSGAYDYVATLFVDYPDSAERAASQGFMDPYCLPDTMVEACGGDAISSCMNATLPPLETACETAEDVLPQIIPELCNSYGNRSQLLSQLSTMSAAALMTSGIQQEAYQKFVEQRQLLDGRSFTCPQIWNLTYLGLHRHAMEVYNYAISVWEKLNGRVNMLGWCSGFNPSAHEVFELFAPWVGTDDPDMSLNQIARRLMRRELEKGSVAALQANAVNQHSTVTNLTVPVDSELSMIERSRNADPAWAERSRLLVSATTLPYYQGLGLFFLAIVFPFFAMLLLIPGKHAGFFLWFGLWAWLKSWDVAYSIVMLLSDALYNLFIVNLLDVQNIFTMGLQPDMAVAMFSMRQIDPTYDLTMYYHILAICLLSIPTITGYVVLGAFRGGQGLISQGASMIPVSPKAIYDGIREKEQLIEMYEPLKQSGNSSSKSNQPEKAAPTLQSANTARVTGQHNVQKGYYGIQSPTTLATSALTRNPDDPNSLHAGKMQADPYRQKPSRETEPPQPQQQALPAPSEKKAFRTERQERDPIYLEHAKKKEKITVKVKERAFSGYNDKD